jgi:hypothetical protein
MDSNKRLLSKDRFVQHKYKIKDRVTLSKIAVIPLFFILAITLVFAQDNLAQKQKAGVNDKKSTCFQSEGLTKRTNRS